MYCLTMIILQQNTYTIRIGLLMIPSVRSIAMSKPVSFTFSFIFLLYFAYFQVTYMLTNDFPRGPFQNLQGKELWEAFYQMDHFTMTLQFYSYFATIFEDVAKDIWTLTVLTSFILHLSTFFSSTLVHL